MADNESFMRHWTRAQPTVASYVSSMVPDFHEAEDLLQEIAVILLRKFSQYDERRPFVAWALGIAKLEVLAKRRSRARSLVTLRNEAVESVTATYADMAPELEERAVALRECLKQLAGRALALVKLRYQEALPPREVAGRLQEAPGTVRVALSRVRLALQECIERKVGAREKLA